MQEFRPEALAILSKFLQGLISADDARKGVRRRVDDYYARKNISLSGKPSSFTLLIESTTDKVGVNAAIHPASDAERIHAQCVIIASFLPLCQALDLRGPVATIRKIEQFAEEADPPPDQLIELMRELQGRLYDELNSVYFFSLTPREAGYYSKPRDGWEEIIARFPEASDDIEEAYKCFALSRYAAAVFHSVQIIEHGLIALGEFLQIKDPLSGWTATSNELRRIAKTSYENRSDFEKHNSQFIEQTHGTVEALKNAWRNKISHAQGKLAVLTTNFSPEIAEEILFASRSFMRRLAEGLPSIQEPFHDGA